ncbi:hypothetical protein PZA11_002566 [Diplocarpon coronariae]
MALVLVDELVEVGDLDALALVLKDEEETDFEEIVVDLAIVDWAVEEVLTELKVPLEEHVPEPGLHPVPQ